jgi:hypothetical protein
LPGSDGGGGGGGGSSSSGAGLGKKRRKVGRRGNPPALHVGLMPGLTNDLLQI